MNTGDTPSPAGLVGALRSSIATAARWKFRTDGDWQSAKTVPENWTADATPAAGWGAAMALGPMGMAPWGDAEESPAAVDEIPDVAIPSRVLAEMGVPPDFKSSPNLRLHPQTHGRDRRLFCCQPGTARG